MNFREETNAPAHGRASGGDGNVPGDIVDDNLGTPWSALGDGPWIQFDLGSSRTIAHVAIAFYSGNTRQSRFDLQTSSDGTSWTKVLPGATSSGATLEPQTFDFPDRPARYVRDLGHGNTVNTWNALTEFNVFAPPN